MKVCHVCLTECEDFYDLCPLCGADLRVEAEAELENTDAEEKVVHRPVLLASMEDIVSAEIFKDILKDNGIPYVCPDSEEGTMRVLFGGAFVADDIYVDSSDFEAADKLYTEFLNSEEEFDGEFIEEDDEP